MKTKIIILFLLILILNSKFIIVNAQPVQQQWVRIWDDSSHLNDHTSGVALDNAGNVYVAGDSFSGSFFTTIKYSPSGVQQWVASYPGNPGFECRGIIVDTAGNSYVTALSGNIFTQIFNFVLFKYNTMGQLQWARSFGDYSHSYYANDCIIDRQGNIYVVGETNAYGGYMIMLVKYSPNGDTLGTHFYSYPGNSMNGAISIAIDSLNNVIMGGECYPTNNPESALILKYSSTGNLLWSTTFTNGLPGSRFLKVGVDLNNNIYAIGYCNYPSGSSDFPQYLTTKYNSSGVQQWYRVYRGSYTNSSNYARSLALDIQGNIYITGQTEQSAPGNSSFGTIKYNSNGDSLWTRILLDLNTNNDNNCVYDIKLDVNANVYVYGETDSNNGVRCMTTLKYDNLGNQKWIVSYPGIPKATTKIIAVDQNYDVYVVGDKYPAGTGWDYITVKYSQLIGIKPISKIIADDFKLYQNYPNPFNPATNIKFEIKPPLTPLLTKEGTQGVVLKIYDILGHEVTTLVDEKLNPGTYEIKWDGSQYSSGIYFYKLETENFSQTNKMILIK